MDVLDSYFSYLKNISVMDENKKYKLIPILCKYMSLFHCMHEDEVELVFFTNEVIDVLRYND